MSLVLNFCPYLLPEGGLNLATQTSRTEGKGRTETAAEGITAREPSNEGQLHQCCDFTSGCHVSLTGCNVPSLYSFPKPLTPA